MNRLIGLVLLVALAACSSGPRNPTPDEKITALASHLSTVDPPAGWTLTRVRLRGGHGFIDAKLGPEARLQALSVAPEERRYYFAYPCPTRGSPVWAQFRGRKDIYVAVNIDGGRRRFLVSCRTSG